MLTDDDTPTIRKAIMSDAHERLVAAALYEFRLNHTCAEQMAAMFPGYCVPLPPAAHRRLSWFARFLGYKNAHG